MPTTCVSPACSSGYPSANKEEHVTFHRFPSDIFLRDKWIKKIPRKNWKWNNNHRLCSRHFSADDYKVGSLDTNARRRIKKDQQVRKILKNNSVPTIWPGLPSHLIKQQSLAQQN